MYRIFMLPVMFKVEAVGLEPTCPKNLIYSQASQPIAQRLHIGEIHR